MNRFSALFLAILLCLLPPMAQASLPPVEDRRPNTDYTPAFTGQTRAPGLQTQTPYRTDILTRDLDEPWGIIPLPDGRLAITQKGGMLRLYDPAAGLSEAISGFPKVESRGQGGLLDLALAPDFPESRMMYFTLAERTGEGSLTALGRGRLAGDEQSIEAFEILYRARPYNRNAAHFGSRLAFGQDGFVYMTTGERQTGETRVLAQSLQSAYGKILRLTAEGQPATGNPFDGEAGALPEIFTLGHRNVQGLAFHPQTGRLWANEMGPRGGDELNLILPGKNYGWPEISYGIEYSGGRVGLGLTIKEGMEQPVYYWDPVLAPSGMVFYASEVIPEWQNNLFIADLASRHISRLVLEGEKVVGEERLLEGEGQRFRDLTEGLDGALYAVTDEGRLYRIGT